MPARLRHIRIDLPVPLQEPPSEDDRTGTPAKPRCALVRLKRSTDIAGLLIGNGELVKRAPERVPPRNDPRLGAGMALNPGDDLLQHVEPACWRDQVAGDVGGLDHAEVDVGVEHVVFGFGLWPRSHTLLALALGLFEHLAQVFE
jgi:hypothetical protein